MKISPSQQRLINAIGCGKMSFSSGMHRSNVYSEGGVEPGTFTVSTLYALEDRGLVRRVKDETRFWKSRLELTESGKKWVTTE